MPASIIAQLIIALGPTALELIPKLAAVWTKQDLSVEEVLELCKVARKSYDEYLLEAKGRLGLI
jgi:hypothetical protein